MSQSSIPDETLEHIFSYINNRKDLLSLVVVSKHFSSVAQPHLHYRVIRCTLGTTGLWRQLSEKPLLAQHVRSVEIQRQLEYLNTTFDEPIVPREFLAHAYDPTNRKFYGVLPVEDLPQIREAEGALIQALKKMANLESFTWKRCAPLLDSKWDEDIHDDIWTALATGCPALEHLSLVDASENEEKAPYIRPIHHSAIWKLPQDLKTFEYHSYAYRRLARSVPVDELITMLRRCPNLEVLSLGFTLYSVEEDEEGNDISSANVNELFANMYWPKLNTLRTFSVHITPSTAMKFFKSHPTLTTLEIIQGTYQAQFIKDETFQPLDIYPYPEPSVTLLPGSLPNLKKWRVPKYFSKAIKAARRQM